MIVQGCGSYKGCSGFQTLQAENLKLQEEVIKLQKKLDQIKKVSPFKCKPTCWKRKSDLELERRKENQ